MEKGPDPLNPSPPAAVGDQDPPRANLHGGGRRGWGVWAEGKCIIFGGEQFEIGLRSRVRAVGAGDGGGGLQGALGMGTSGSLGKPMGRGAYSGV